MVKQDVAVAAQDGDFVLIQPSEKNLADIKAGYDRYSFAECHEDPHARRMADFLAKEAATKPFHVPPLWAKQLFFEKIEELWQEMQTTHGLRIAVADHEPYLSLEEMLDDVKRHWFVVRRKQVCRVTGALCMKLRAVHDFYGHVQLHAPFNLRGETDAYSRHCHQFHPAMQPWMHNTFKLENAHRLVYGRFFTFTSPVTKKPVQNGASPSVFDFEFFEATPQEWYRRWL